MAKGLEQCDKCDYFISVEDAYKQGYQDGGEDMEKAKQIIIDGLLKQIEQIRADAIEEVINNCSKEYQVWSDDTVCKIWLSKLEQLKERR